MPEAVSTIYDGTAWASRLPGAIIPVGIGIALWTLSNRRSDRIPAKHVLRDQIFGWIMLGVGALYSLYLALWIYGDATAEGSGRVLVAEGPIGTIEHNVANDYSKAGADITTEILNVDGIRFVHDDSWIYPGFHLISNEQGPLVEGCHVRIIYTPPLQWNLPVTRILKIQIVQTTETTRLGTIDHC